VLAAVDHERYLSLSCVKPSPLKIRVLGANKAVS
jgi:hypothetical protein